MNMMRKFVSVALGMLLGCSSVHAQLSQSPLFDVASSVKPNVMLALDTSGSMEWACIYASSVPRASLAVIDPVYGSGTAGENTGCVPVAEPATVAQAIWQVSPDNNTLFYDPRIRYMPRYNADGTRMANASTAGVSVITYLYNGSGSRALVANYTRIAIPGAASYTKRSANRTDCVGPTSCSAAEELQNVANWQAFHRTRLAAAQTALAEAFILQNNTFRLGWSELVTRNNGTFTSGVRDFDQTTRNNFFNWLYSRTPLAGTPLRETLAMIGQYYSQMNNSGPWAHTPWSPGSERASDHLACRRSFAILTTDGYWNNHGGAAVGNADNTGGPRIRSDIPGVGDFTPTATAGYRDNASETLADVAMYYWKTDLRRDLKNRVQPRAASPANPAFWQNMTTYTVGFGVTGTLTSAQLDQARTGAIAWPTPTAEQQTTVDDLAHAAHNGRGTFEAVTDTSTFAQSLSRVLSEIATGEFNHSGVAATTTTLGTTTVKYEPSFVSGQWWGNLRALRLDGTTGEELSTSWQVVSVDASGAPTGTTTIPAAGSRNILTRNTASNTTVAFTWANVSGLRSASAASTPNRLAQSFNSDMVDYIRGVRTLEGGATGFRQRATVMGDVVNSNPVFVRNNETFDYSTLNAGAALTAYSGFRTQKAARAEGVVWIGANDGMLHAFGQNDGRELFAYIPAGVMPNLHLLTQRDYQHRYFVDGPLVEADGFDGSAWRNLVLGTTGAGAQSVFAIHNPTTNPTSLTAASVLWELTPQSTGMSNLGHVMGDIQTGPLRDGTFVAVFGNGYYSSSGVANLFVVNMMTGAKIAEFTAGTSPNNGLGGVRLVRDNRGYIIGAYAGDLKGNVWRFDLFSTTAAGPATGTGRLLYTARDPLNNLQPFTATPDAFPHPNGGQMVVIGSGKLFDAADPGDTKEQTVYGLWDKVAFGTAGTVTAIASSELITVTASPVGAYYKLAAGTSIDWTVHRGWRLPLKLAQGQRVIYPIQRLFSASRVETIAPITDSPPTCDDVQTSKAFNFLIDPLSGVCRNTIQIDTNGDQEIDETDATNICGFSAPADGRNTVVLRPTTTQTSGGVTSAINRAVILDSSRKPIQIQERTVTGTTGAVVRSWQQIFPRN